MENHKLTDCQERAIEGMLKWKAMPFKDDKDNLFFLLEGPAGTGKTTAMRYFINEVGKNGIGVSAPTHKAKKQIQRLTGFKGETIQKLLGLRPNVNIDRFDINNPQFDPLGEPAIAEYKILIVDEASMLNKDAFGYLINLAKDYNVRLLFIADAMQLPPINEVKSRVFSYVTHGYSLKTIVRQDDTNPNAALLRILRNDIQHDRDTAVMKLLNKGTNVVNEQGYHVLNNVEFGVELLNKLHSTEYQHDRNFIKYLAYTNNSVERWSEGLRKQIYKADLTNPFIEGEGIIGYSTIRHRQGIVLENSEDYVITKVRVGKSISKIKGYYIEIKAAEGSKHEVFVVDPTDFQEYIKYFDELLAHAQKMRGSHWGRFYAFKESHLLLKSLFKNDYKGQLTAYYKSSLIESKDLYYDYGISVHKSQGSTYTNSAINISNILGNYNAEERRRLMYVACSRMTNENLLLMK